MALAVPAAAQNPTCPTRALGDATNACASTAFVNLQLTGSTTGVFTVGAPVVGNSGGNGLVSGSRSGNTTQFATVSGALVNGHCVTINSGNFVDAGGACVTSGSGVSPGTAQQLAYYASTGSTVTGTFTPSFPATGDWYSDAGANIQRWNDRTFMGGATPLDGKLTPVTTDWLTGLSGGWPSNFTNLLVETLTSPAAGQDGSINAIVGAAQNLYASSSNTANVIGVGGFCFNNNTNTFSGTNSCWGLYGEAHRMNNFASNVFGAEFDARQLGTEQVIDPYNWGSNMAVGLHLGCGAGRVGAYGNPCSSAINIIPNTQVWDAGIVIVNNSLNTVSSHKRAIAMPDTYELTWFSAANTVNGSVFVDTLGRFDINLSNSAIVISGNVGAACSGTPTASFATIGGIVTHC